MKIKTYKLMLKSALFGLAFSYSLGMALADKAPEFKLADLNSGSIQLSDYKGKVVYLDFWATWCGPCRKSFPWMNDMQAKYKDQGLEIIAISLDAKKKLVDSFLKKYPAKFKIALDPDGVSGDAYEVRVMPSSYLIDRKGDIIEQHMGFRDKDKETLEASIKNAVAATN